MAVESEGVGVTISAATKPAFKMKVDALMVRVFADYQFTYEPKVRWIIDDSFDAMESLLTGGAIAELLVESLEAGAMKAIETMPLHVIDELEIAFNRTAVETWPAQPGVVVEAAKRVALIWYDAFWPFEHPEAIAQAARLGNLANSLPAPIFMADMDGRITFSSRDLDDLRGTLALVNRRGACVTVWFPTAAAG